MVGLFVLEVPDLTENVLYILYPWLCLKLIAKPASAVWTVGFDILPQGNVDDPFSRELLPWL